MTDTIIGREGELSIVEAFLDRPSEGTRVLVLEGEPGIGKSTVWQSGVAAARERGFPVLVSRPAESESTLPNVVLGDLFADATPQLLEVLPSPRRRAFESALLLRDEPGLAVDPRALGVAIVTLLPLLAEGRPLVLAIDDDQWVDPSSAATLAFALRRAEGLPILLLLSRRVDEAPQTMLEVAVDQTRVERLRIGPMSLGAVQLLLRRQLDVALSRPGLLRLHEASGGNPFYALELARAGAMETTRDGKPLQVPRSLERLLRSRLSMLNAATLQALLLVAAHGRLPSSLLPTLKVDPADLDPALAAGVVQVSGGVISFTHPLLASAVYQRGAAAVRRTAHRLLTTIVADPVLRGRHLALGAESPGTELSATLEQAARIANHRGLPIAAAELAEHATRLTPADAADDRRRRAILTAEAHMAAGEGAHALSLVDNLLADSSAGLQRAEALMLRSEFSDPAAAIALLGDALREAAGAPALEASIYVRLAMHGRLTKGSKWAERHARAAVRLAERIHDDALLANALATVALLRFDQGDPQALQLARRTHQLMAEHNEPGLMPGAWWIVPQALVWSGMIDQARDWLQGQLEDWGDRDEHVRSEALWYLALVELSAGHPELAESYSDQAREIGVAYGTELPQDYFPAALIALHRGHLEAARDSSRRALDLARGQLLPAHTAILGVCDLWGGDPSAAVTRLLDAEDKADTRGWGEPGLRWWRADLVEALLAIGRIEDAVAMLDDWEGAARRLRRARLQAQIARCRGLVAAARGDVAEALRLLEGACEQQERVGDPIGYGRSLLALGMTRRRTRQKQAARQALAAALATFETIGAASWSDGTRLELARIGGRSRIEGLSPSELRVAELVAEGRTNREIASTLFLAERTVASHLTHAYAKLGVRSRTELAGSMRPRSEEPVTGTSKVPTS